MVQARQNVAVDNPACPHKPVDRLVRGGIRSTRLSFFIAGFALTCWAPLVPFAQQRSGADAAMLGTILLCLGLGAVIGMPIAAALAGRIGTKPLIIAGGLGLVIILPLLGVLATPASLGLCLIFFGGSIGTIDVAANMHGIEVQRQANRPLMSSFHGMYSLGGLMGASSVAAMLSVGTPLTLASSLPALVVMICVLISAPLFLNTRSGEAYPLITVPKGVVVTIGALLFIIFLAEGALLDWSAILLAQHKNVDVSSSGTGYAAFAIAMAISRGVGDKLIARLGERNVMMFGFMLTGVSIASAAYVQSYLGVMAGMLAAGFAAGNIVPALFNLAGRQSVMPAQQAVAAISMLGYLGVLAGPAVVGYLAHFIGLIGAFYAVSILVAAMTLTVTKVCGRAPHAR